MSREFWVPTVTASIAALSLCLACSDDGEQTSAGSSGSTETGTSASTSGDGDGDATGDGDGDATGDGDGDATGDGDGDGDGDAAGDVTGDGDGDDQAIGCPNPVFTNDFDDDALGTYVDLADWNDPSWNQGVDDGRVEIIEGADAFAGRSLRVRYPQGGVGPSAGGAQWRLNLDTGYEELHLAYRIRFGGGFDFVKGGKIPGLTGGTAPTGCVDDDTGFSARGMWRAQGQAVQYMYWPEKLANCGDDYDYMLDGEPVAFVAGQWHQLEHRLVMNTPGVADGVLQAWVDGQLVLDVQDFLFRTADYDYVIDQMYFSTFFGGSQPDWAPTKDETIDFDDFVVCTEPITY